MVDDSKCVKYSQYTMNISTLTQAGLFVYLQIVTKIWLSQLHQNELHDDELIHIYY